MIERAKAHVAAAVQTTTRAVGRPHDSDSLRCGGRPTSGRQPRFPFASRYGGP
jgi:hypothetical protein